MVDEKIVKDIFANFYKENNEITNPKSNPKSLSFLNFLKYFEKQRLLKSSYHTLLFKSEKNSAEVNLFWIRYSIAEWQEAIDDSKLDDVFRCPYSNLRRAFSLCTTKDTLIKESDKLLIPFMVEGENIQQIFATMIDYDDFKDLAYEDPTNPLLLINIMSNIEEFIFDTKIRVYFESLINDSEVEKPTNSWISDYDLEVCVK
ncbi:6192_t:CDS:2, partial [Gigaspora margarita]